MNTRFKIICILFGIAYLYFIGVTFIQEIPGMKAGFTDGFNSVDALNREGQRSNVEIRKMKSIEFYVIPISGEYSFPDSVLNLKTGSKIFAEFPFIKTKIDTSQFSHWISVVSSLFLSIFAFPVLFAIVFIPVQIFRVIRSIVKNEIFDARNVTRIRWIGYSLLLIFVMQIFSNLIDKIEARALVSLENYKIVFKMGEELYTLLFALVTFMFAEILKLSHAMKEEQDLTI